MTGDKPRYLTREELEAGIAPQPALPPSAMLRLGLTPAGLRLDEACVRATGFSYVSWLASRGRGIGYQPALVLTTLGAKSRQKRCCVLPYSWTGAEYLVMGSHAGGPRDPYWVSNLRVDPASEVHVRRRAVSTTGRILDGAERDEAMALIARKRTQIYNYEAHARAHGRRVEIAALRPV